MTEMVYRDGARLMLKYGKLTFDCLTPEQRTGTCGYWVLVRNNHCALTAFHSQAGFLKWLARYKLEIDIELPATGVHMFGRITGAYGRIYHDEQTFAAVVGDPQAVLSNGSYYTGKLAFDEGFAVEHVPHFDAATPLDYLTTREAENPGYR